jgi:hypothetical protein
MMPREPAAAILLLIGTLLGMSVMVLHPTGADIVNSQNFAGHALLNRGVHGVAIASLPLLVLGFAGLCRRLGWPDLATAGLVVYAFAAVAVMIAAVASGFIATDLIERMFTADAATLPILRAQMVNTHAWNQAFAAVNVVAGSAAILLWSLAILKRGAMPRALAYAGIVIGILVPAAVISGHVRLEIHGFGAIVFLHGAWTIAVAAFLFRADPRNGPAPLDMEAH